MGSESDSWDQPLGAEAYREAVRTGSIHRTLAERLLRRLNIPGDGRVLDLGCGTGIAAEIVSSRLPDALVAGLDRAGAMLRTGRAGVPLETAGFVLAAPERLPFAARVFDAALSSAAFWHFPFWRCALEEAFRTVKPGGRLAFNVPAAQLSDVEDAPPAPLQSALVSEGERRFARPPAPSAVELRRAEIAEAAAAAGWMPEGEDLFDVVAPQRELSSLLEIPAIAARFYPESSAPARERWIAAALARIDPEENFAVRWWEICLSR